MEVTVGIDSHKYNLTVAVIDALGRGLASCDFVNHPDAWKLMFKWMHGFGTITAVGIEGSGQYGAAVAKWLMAQGIVVKEVPAHMTYQERKRTPSRGKSDLNDASKIALVTLRENQDLRSAGRDQPHTDLKVAVEYRDQLVRSRTQQANRAHALLATIRPGSLPKVKLTTSHGLKQALAAVRGDHQVSAELVRAHVAEIRRLTMQIQKMDHLLQELLSRMGTTLTAQVGIGAMIAARILAETKGVGRIRSKAGFAMLSGTAPIPASSGQVQRHRLNRGGNRSLNHCIHMVAVNRLRLDPDSRAYYQRKITEGKTKKEALRALKRQVANRIYQCLEQDADLATMTCS
jgi:transposase